MMWDAVMERVRALILNDNGLATIFGDNYRMAGTGALQCPGLEWSLLGDTEGELWAPMLVQFDCFTYEAAATRESERRLRSLLHQNLPITIDGITLFAQYTEGSMLSTPDRSGIVGRAVRFRLTPLRAQYALAVPNVF